MRPTLDRFAKLVVRQSCFAALLDVELKTGNTVRDAGRPYSDEFSGPGIHAEPLPENICNCHAASVGQAPDSWRELATRPGHSGDGLGEKGRKQSSLTLHGLSRMIGSEPRGPLLPGPGCGDCCGGFGSSVLIGTASQTT